MYQLRGLRTGMSQQCIYEGGVEWAVSDGTSVKGTFTLLDGTVVDADQKNAPLSWIPIISLQISAPNARVFMKSRNALRFARLIAVCLMKCTGNGRRVVGEERKNAYLI